MRRPNQDSNNTILEADGWRGDRDTDQEDDHYQGRRRDGSKKRKGKLKRKRERSDINTRKGLTIIVSWRLSLKQLRRKVRRGLRCQQETKSS